MEHRPTKFSLTRFLCEWLIGGAAVCLTLLFSRHGSALLKVRRYPSVSSLQNDPNHGSSARTDLMCFPLADFLLLSLGLLLLGALSLL